MASSFSSFGFVCYLRSVGFELLPSFLLSSEKYKREKWKRSVGERSSHGFLGQEDYSRSEPIKLVGSIILS